MWQIDNRTHFAVGQSWIRDMNGAETWLVVVKATFDVLPSRETALSAHQLAVTRHAIYRGEPGRSSLLYENDFVLAKRTTDVLLNGSAYATGGQVRSLEVTMQVGPVTKTLRVVGDRTWKRPWARLSAPEPFRQMPLVYERAFGGTDRQSKHPEADFYWLNPVGTGFVASRGRIFDAKPPNIEYPKQPVRGWKSRPAPAGLGVVASHWWQRARWAGTYDDEWAQTRQPLVPEDFDIRHYQCAPEDQQPPGFLQGGESVVLTNVSPVTPLRFRLPRLDLALETFFMDGERREHEPPLLHTVLLEPDFPRVSLIWHSALECHSKVYQLCRTRVDLHDTAPAQDGEDEDFEAVDDLLDLA